jgi:hypothetical protein
MRHQKLVMNVWLILLALCALSVVGCVPQDETSDDAEFKQAIPLAQSMVLEVPASQGSGQLALGDKSSLYELTRLVSGNVNAHVAVILAYPALISLLPPTEKGEGFRVWGPSEPQGLEKISWRMRMDKISADRFSFKLEGRPKGSTDEAAFLPVMTGEVTPHATDRLKSKGTLKLLFDNSFALDSDPCNTGTIDVVWDAQSTTRAVQVIWTDYENKCEDDKLENATYEYTEAPDKAGTFEFITHSNIHDAAENKPLKDTMSITSRWLSSGQGRSDVVISGEEVTADLQAAALTETAVQATQCWSDLFVLTYADTNPDALEAAVFPNIGKVDDCPFQDAQFASVP